MSFKGTAWTAAIALGAAAHAQQPAPAGAEDDTAALRAEIERLKSIVPGQAFAMTQVAYNPRRPPSP